MLTGTLDDFTLADVFKLLSFSKKTGRLELTRKAGMGRVFFRDGEVYYAESSLAREPLGQKLIRSRALTETHLRQALDEHAESGERVGQILLREGWINGQQLEEAVKQQIEDAVFDLLRWERGDFGWEANATLEPEVPISVSVENLIMEASRRLDELEVIARKVPSRHAVVAVAPAPPEGAVEINITPDEWRVLVLVDGSRSVEDIANTLGLDEFHTMKIVHGMVSAGLIEVVGEGAASEDAPPPPPPSEEPAAPPPPPPPTLEVVTAAEAIADEEDEEDEEDRATLPAPEPTAFEVVEEQGAMAFEDLSEVVETPAEAPLAPEDGLVEETLFEAGASASDDLASPPEEWFADPDLALDAFDAPEPGDLVAELPDAPADEPLVDQPLDDPEALVEVEAGETPATAISDDGLVDAADEIAALASEPEPEEAPSAPSIEPVEGVDRTVAVRELSGLFDDVPERPKRPSIRRLEPGAVEGLQKRRVEDDEQVTKSLISRLIEGVKGL